MTMRIRYLACITFVLLACQKTPAAAPEVAPDAGAVQKPQGQAWVHPQSLDDNDVFQGAGPLLAPAQARASVALPFTASVTELRADKGQHVREGAVLATVVIPDAARAAAQLDGERLRQEAYRERLQHLERLRAEGLVRAGEVAELKARLRESEATALEAQALLATIEATGLRRRGRGYEVVAPLTGVVVELRAARGGVHGPSDGPLLVVAGGLATRVEARFAFAPPDGVGYRMIAPDGSVTGVRLSAKSPQLSAADATQVCWFELEQPTELAPGTLVRVQVVPAPDLWIVPRSALTTGLRLATGATVAARVLATLGDQALVRASLAADAQLQAAAP
jgi:biotin carboxyl carrier protein